MHRYDTFKCTSGDGCADGFWKKCESKSYCWRDHGMTKTVAGDPDEKTGSFAQLVANWEDSADSGSLVNKNGNTGYPSCFPGPGAVYDGGMKYNGDGP